MRKLKFVFEKKVETLAAKRLDLGLSKKHYTR